MKELDYSGISLGDSEAVLAIVTALAEGDPMTASSTEWHMECTLCSADVYYTNPEHQHLVTCPWRRARELLRNLERAAQPAPRIPPC